MAHFALLDNTDTVLQVVRLSNEDVNNLDFPESDPVGIEVLNFLYSNEQLEQQYPGKSGFYWKQTSYNDNFRCRYAGIGMKYRSDFDVFYSAQPYPSWIYSSVTHTWDPPIEIPFDQTVVMGCEWDEENFAWKPNDYPSWKFNSSSGVYEAPVPNPFDPNEVPNAQWDEENQTWFDPNA